MSRLSESGGLAVLVSFRQRGVDHGLPDRNRLFVGLQCGTRKEPRPTRRDNYLAGLAKGLKDSDGEKFRDALRVLDAHVAENIGAFLSGVFQRVQCQSFSHRRNIPHAHR